MKNHYKWITAFLLVVSVFFGMTSCQPETEIKYVEVEKQPDGVAPADVTDLTATNKDASVLLTWTDATDEDIYGYEVSWKTSTENRAAAAMESNSLIVAPGAKGCYVTNLKNGTGYTFTVKTVDVTGMKSTGVTKTITPSIIVGAAADISLVPSTTEKTNQDVTVKVEINSEITANVEKITCARGLYTEIYEVLNGTDITETKEFTATSNNTYTVAITYTDETYNFFFVKITNIDKTAPSNVTNVITTYSKETGKITLSWENPTDEDFVGTKIVYGLEDSEETITLTFDKDATETVLENINTGTYTVEIFTRDDVGNESDVKTKEIPMTIPSITSLSIPVAGISYAGQMLPVTIKGENLDSYLLYLETTGATLQNITVISSTKITAEIPCPSTVGTSEVTVSYGESSATGTLKVLAAEKCFVVGDVLLTDGTRIKAENAQYGIPSDKNAFAVIVSAPYGGGVGKARGLQQSASKLKWAPDDTTGTNTTFTNIICEPSQTGEGAALTATFTGDTEGSDNWAEICDVDPEGTKDAATNYPIFNFANTYGATAGLTDTDYENGWYVPSIAELCEVYKNGGVIRTSITKAGGDLLGSSYYWSSSQSWIMGSYAHYVYFADGDVDYRGKWSKNCYVFVLQAFNAEQFNNYEYNTAEISSVEIPTIAEGFVGEVPVTITGKDLIQKITVSGLTISRIDYISDAQAIAYATTTGTETETTIAVSCGTASATTTLKVIESVNSYEVGDIILTNGTKVSVANVETYTIDENNKPIGVVAMISDDYGVLKPKVIGLKKSASTLMWAPDGTTGYNTKFTNIVCIPSKTGSGAALTATFTGDTDGSDNWEEICAVDPEGTKDPATNYPIFNFANTYGATAGLSDTVYENGWYVPSLAELCEVYKNKDVIQTSLTKASGFTIGTSYYWSSSQIDSYNTEIASRVDFYDGSVGIYGKYYNSNVFVLQALTAE